MAKKYDHYNPGNWSGKPYNFFGDYLKDKYKCRVLKLPINAGLLCPNRDGSLGTAGCIFCSEDGSASPSISGFTGIRQQMESARKNFKRSDMATAYIAYFQAFTNTHGHIEELRKLYNTAINFENVTGLMIGTRPDALPDDVLDLIASYKNDNFELWLEVGMQTMHDKSLAFLNRGHNHSATVDAVVRAAQRDIPLCVHIILGIPGESWEEMMDTAREISRLPVSGIKIHHLHIISNTPLEEVYRKKKFPLLTLKEYSSILCDFLERTRPDIIVHRLMGDREENTLVAPRWGMHKGTVLKAIDDQFEKRGTYQGFLLNEV